MPDTDLYPREDEIDDGFIEKLVEALHSAYPAEDFLYNRLANKWGVRVGVSISSLGRPSGLIFQDIATYARSEGRALDLLGLAWSDKPNNGKLKQLAAIWLSNPDPVLAKYGAAAPAGTPSLQRLINKSSRPVNLADFMKDLGTMSHALCRVCIPYVNGTGFLIGRQTVLTNHHVVDPAIKLETPGEQIVCEFDYFERIGDPIRRHGRAGKAWLGPNSPHSPSDLTGSGVPGENELDFAIIHLAEPVEPERVALALPYTPPLVTVRDFVFIGQHPGGEEAQIALGQVVENPAGGLRYRYDVTTESGSSGSPVLDFALRLVGLHHAADPAQSPRYNQGVPIARIRRALLDHNLDPENL